LGELKFRRNKKERVKLLKKLNCVSHFTPIGCLAMIFDDVAGQFFNSITMIHEMSAIYEVKYKKIK
jgi:hypothetical protein